jgi:hypothetical protein
MAEPARAITDSPWFWLCLFALAALVGLAAIGPKYAQRQAQIEREFQGRQRAAQSAQGESPSVPLSTPGETIIPLWPLFVALAVFIPIAWFLFWRRTSTQDEKLVSGPGT